MANDPVYRPQKINPSDLEGKEIEMPDNQHVSDPVANKQLLDDMAKMRTSAAAEVGNQLNNPQHDSGIKISGNVPAAFRQALEENYQQEAAPVKNQQKFESQAMRPAQQEMRVTGSNKLEQLIAGAASGSIYESISLPSKGVFYNGEDGPKDGNLHIRPMTGEEEQILATPRFVKQGKALNMIFNRCIREGYNTENFLTQDRTFLLIYLRGISYGPMYDVEVKCPECDRRFADEINLDGDLEVNVCPKTFTSSSLFDVLPTTGYNFSYRLSTGQDEIRVQDYRERRIKGFDTSGQADDTLLYRTALLIEEIEGLTDKEELKLLLKKLPINDIAYIRSVVNEPPFGVNTSVEMVCKSCLQEFEIELPLESNFFFPRTRKKTPTIQ